MTNKQPPVSKIVKMKRKICYVFQGGGALGSYQAGAYNAFQAAGYIPDMMIGISIGGINASIIAGNPPHLRQQKLDQFWNIITQELMLPLVPTHKLNKLHNWFGSQVALYGIPGFYKPRLINPKLLSKTTPDQLSYYDTTPLRHTLKDLIDFDYLNAKHVRLCLGSVELASGEFTFFDNFYQEITMDHVLATGALPPSFPPVHIDGKYYIDGGVFSNTPIFKVLEEFAKNPTEMQNILCFMVDVFSIKGPYPHSLDGLLERVKDIQYSSHSKRPASLFTTTQNLSHAIKYLATLLTPEQLKQPEVKDIIKLGVSHRVDLVRLIYHSPQGTELVSKDYNFSKEAAVIHYNAGYDSAQGLIIAKQHEWENLEHSGLTIFSHETDTPDKSRSEI